MPTAEDETPRRRPASVKLRASPALTKTANAPRLSIRGAAARPDFIGTLNRGRAAAVSVPPAIPTGRMGEPESRRQRFSSPQTIPALKRASNCSSMAAVVKFDQLKRRGVGPGLASVAQRSRMSAVLRLNTRSFVGFRRHISRIYCDKDRYSSTPTPGPSRELPHRLMRQWNSHGSAMHLPQA
jgi:hypothetical protein